MEEVPGGQFCCGSTTRALDAGTKRDLDALRLVESLDCISDGDGVRLVTELGEQRAQGGAPSSQFIVRDRRAPNGTTVVVAHTGACKRDPETIAECDHLDLNILDPFCATLDDRAVGQMIGPRSTTNAVPSLKDGDVPAGICERLGGDQASEAGANDDGGRGFHVLHHIGIMRLGAIHSEGAH